MSEAKSEIAVVYYSLTGNTKLIAETIAEELGADIIILKPIDDLNPEGKTKFMWGGAKAMMRTKPELESYNFSPEKYKLVLIGSPVWAWTITPPIRTFLEDNDLTNLKTAFFLSCAGAPKKATRNYIKALEGTNLIGNVSFVEPLLNDTDGAKERAKTWANEIKQQVI